MFWKVSQIVYFSGVLDSRRGQISDFPRIPKSKIPDSISKFSSSRFPEYRFNKLTRGDTYLRIVEKDQFKRQITERRLQGGRGIEELKQVEVIGT